ncbi:hypothetical protein CLIB1444_04S10770 [[Candida] jaroonii]|uniref:Uncharacterized protein n=1 Tax=[Candida] jaroonii TaxID=467808 RepID=A0ACA9Y876_9ASCO|nr:hypothetical protein CLIB1444_04S10770 [[Candida] jaroonii]
MSTIPVSETFKRTPIDLQFLKIIAIVLRAQGYHVTNDFLTELNEMALKYFSDLIDDLKTFTELQRRTVPTVSDVQNAFKYKQIDYNGMYLQHVRNKKIYSKYQKEINSVNHQTSTTINNLQNITFDAESEVFFNEEEYEIAELVPRDTKKPSYIPNYFPDLPPDYTYQNTARYIEPLKDMEKLRLRLVEESRLTEQSLYTIIGDNEDEWKKNIEIEISEDESLLSLTELPMIASPIQRFDAFKPPELPEYAEDEDEETKVEEKPVVIDKSFDFVAYANKRKIIRDRKEQEIIDRRNKRGKNVFMKAEKYFSPYATQAITGEIRQFFKDNLNHELGTVIRAIKADTVKQKETIERLISEKEVQEKEREKERETIEFGFNFGDEKVIDSDSDGEVNDEDIVFATDQRETDVANEINGTDIIDMAIDTPIDMAIDTPNDIQTEPNGTNMFQDLDSDMSDLESQLQAFNDE